MRRIPPPPFQEQLDELNAEREQIQAEIVKKSNELAQQMNMTATKGGYIWPETVSRKITSPMGPCCRSRR